MRHASELRRDNDEDSEHDEADSCEERPSERRRVEIVQIPLHTHFTKDVVSSKDVWRFVADENTS